MTAAVPQPLDQLTPGMLVPWGGNRCSVVPPELAAAFRPGDRLYVVQTTGALLHVPAGVSGQVTAEVDSAVAAFAALRSVPRDAVRSFYLDFAGRLADDDVWAGIDAANASDVARARDLGRSTTRLAVSDRVRADMIEGLHGWAESLQAPADDVVATVDHDDWQVRIVSAPLGVIGFVFEGRPNVFADAAGVLATGNTAVLRIGGDALETAQAILAGALEPALTAAGLPDGAISLVPVRDRSAGWALFSDPRLALAVVRGSGRAVTELSSVARQAGIPVSAHGTGGAWLVADDSAGTERFAGAVRHSLDRKVCNTLNVAVVPESRAAELIPVLLAAADEAAAARGGAARIHVAEGSQQHVGAAEFERTIGVQRAEGEVTEPRASLLPVGELGTEWEWENTPELSVVVVPDLTEAAALFNAHSPQFVVSLIATDPQARVGFAGLVNAPFVGDGFTRWVDGQYALRQPELGLSNWENGRLLGRAGILSGADLTTRRVFATHDSAQQHR